MSIVSRIKSVPICFEFLLLFDDAVFRLSLCLSVCSLCFCRPFAMILKVLLFRHSLISKGLLESRLSLILDYVPACSYLLVLDRTNWRTNILTGLLIPYIFFSLPSLLFNIFR